MDKIGVFVRCERCGARCLVEPPQESKAKMLRRSKKKGLCVNCAVTDWFRNTYPINMQLAEYGPGILAHPHIRELFADIMRTAGADAKPEEINWNLVNENWDLPFAHKVKPRSDNPITQAELDDIKAGKYKAIDTPAPLSEKAKLLLDSGLVIKSLEELNVLDPGLGDEFKGLLTNNSKKGITEMAKTKKKVTKGEQLDLIDVAPENAKAIVAAARVYKMRQKERLDALKKEIAEKQKVLALVKEAKLKPLESGIIRFTCEGFTISITPRDELIKVKEEAPQEPKS